MIELFIIFALWRLTSLIHREDGPFDMFARFRMLLGVRYDEYSNPTATGMLSKGLICFWCVSIWMSFPAAFLSEYSQSILSFIVVWLAYSAIVIFLDEISDMISRVGRM